MCINIKTGGHNHNNIKSSGKLSFKKWDSIVNSLVFEIFFFLTVRRLKPA